MSIKEPERRIEQIDFYTGEHIGYYDNLHAAAKDNGLLIQDIKKSIERSYRITDKRKLKFRYA